MPPSISNVTWYSAAQKIVISGTGFGSHSPYTGKSSFIQIIDLAGGVGEGYTTDPYNLSVMSWSDSEVQTGWTPTSMGSFGSLGLYGMPGHKVRVTIWDANGQNPTS